MANLNPLRYRGYFYDSDTGLYYLQSRYYDPETGRFINADNQLSTGGNLTGLNLFTYCGNNPMNRIDPTGEAWYHWAIGAAIVAGCAIATVATCGGFAAAALAVGMVGSGMAAATTASTVAAATFIGSATAYGTGALIAASTSSSVQEFNDQGNWGTVAATAGGAVLGGASAYASTRGSSSSKTPSSPISSSDARRIQNAANRTNQNITVVGSRANGTAGSNSDWDYIMSGNSAQRHSAASSVPRGVWGGENNTGIDIFSSYSGSPNPVVLDRSRAYIEFFPE